MFTKLQDNLLEQDAEMLALVKIRGRKRPLTLSDCKDSQSSEVAVDPRARVKHYSDACLSEDLTGSDVWQHPILPARASLQRRPLHDTATHSSMIEPFSFWAFISLSIAFAFSMSADRCNTIGRFQETM